MGQSSIISRLNPLALWGRTNVDRTASKMNNLVLNATQELQLGSDWAANIAVSDLLAREPSAMPTAVASIVDRLRRPNPHVQLLALMLLESCMKNCGQDDLRFPRAAASNDLLGALALLAVGKNLRPRGLFQFRCASSNLAPEQEDSRRKEQEVQELSRVLLRSWAEGFAAVEADVPLFNATYMRLLKSGVGFPELSAEEKIDFRIRSPAALEAEAIVARVSLFREVLGAAASDARSDEMVGELSVELEHTKEDLQQRMPGMEDEETVVLFLEVLRQVEAALLEFGHPGMEASGGVAEGTPAAATEAHADSQLGEFAPACEDTCQRTRSSDDLAALLGLNSPTRGPVA